MHDDGRLHFRVDSGGLCFFLVSMYLEFIGIVAVWGEAMCDVLWCVSFTCFRDTETISMRLCGSSTEASKQKHVVVLQPCLHHFAGHYQSRDSSIVQMPMFCFPIP